MRDPKDRWRREVKAGDDFLDRVFESYLEELGLPNLMRKTDYHQLARLVPRELVPDEVKEKLDAIVQAAELARRDG